MRAHDIFFYAAIFFLAGIFIASLTVHFISTAAITLFISMAAGTLAATLWFAGKKELLVYSIILLMGSGYYVSYAYYHRQPNIVFEHTTTAQGIVIHVEHRLGSQELLLDNNLKIYAARYPEIAYGDRIEARGSIKRSRTPLYAGIISYPIVMIISRHEGSALKEKLLAFRKQFENNIKQVLPRERAALLTGLTVGSTAEFSKEFKDQLLASGTSHIVALSGANLLLIMQGIANSIGLFISRKKTFWVALLIIFLFVIMTGAEASLVRAAIMGIIILAAGYYERAHSFRNAIVAAAFGIILYNPNLLTFDLGFQLSFLALLGIAYLPPRLEWWSPIKNKNFLMTVAAQIAVMPLLLIKTGRAALWAFIPNTLIAGIVPWTTGMGFLTGALGFISPAFAFLPAWITNILLAYEMAVIRLFAFGG